MELISKDKHSVKEGVKDLVESLESESFVISASIAVPTAEGIRVLKAGTKLTI